jgi:hypothetical protein
MEERERRMKWRNDEMWSAAVCLEGRHGFPQRRETKRMGVSHQS